MKFLALAVALMLAGLVSDTRVAAQASTVDLMERLSAEQRKAYEDYAKAKDQFDRRLKAYWTLVDSRRDGRRAKHRAGEPYVPTDYVMEQPPRYAGPELAADIAKIVAQLKPAGTEPAPLPNVVDILEHAKQQYGFVPTAASEQDFKRNYAREALSLGLTKDQVVRIYALETGGLGTYDMQSGINPHTRTGKPISSALGYAQLLHANSTSELVKHGEGFIKRLTTMAASPRITKERADELRAKAQVLRRMLRAARSIPHEWYAHVRFASTPAGLGIHALNLDADVGPWLQVLKLKGLKDDAARAGRADMSGAEMEMMNLAGPRTGLEMMTPLAQNVPTSNFFSQGGYYRNGIVRERTSSELMKALEQRMDANMKKAGSVEFAQIFDEVGAAR